MKNESLTVAIIGCGRLGQIYATAYAKRPDTTIVAIADANAERLEVVGNRFGVTRLFADASSLFEEVVPDVVALVLPVRHIKAAVLAAVAAGVRGITTDKPIAASLADADAMVEICRDAGVVLGGPTRSCGLAPRRRIRTDYRGNTPPLGRWANFWRWMPRLVYTPTAHRHGSR